MATAVAVFAMACGSEADAPRDGDPLDIYPISPVAGTPDRSRPTIPDDLELPARLMFCVPLRPNAASAGFTLVGTIALAAPGEEVAYREGTCSPDIDDNGMVLVRAADGNTRRQNVVFGPAPVDLEIIVWTPALIDRPGGNDSLLTARSFERDASVEPASFGPLVILNTTDDGAMVVARVTSDNRGLPLAMFLAGRPLRGRDGQIVAPTIGGEITDTLAINGFSSADADRLVELLNNGDLE